MTGFSDWSNQIHTKVFKKTSQYPSSHHKAAVKVDDDYVLVGGGVETIHLSGSSKFITESRPNTDLNTWHVRTKDHITPSSYLITTYAIGMKIDGVTAAYLRSKMRVFSKESGVENHPSTNVSIPSNYLLIGGGAEVKYNGNGNLLVHSYPGADTPGGVHRWYAKSKDHQIADRATIKAYAIGIENISFPNIGYIQTDFNGGSAYLGGGGGGYQQASSSPLSGWALTCPGGKSTFSGEGRMITTLYPQNLRFAIASSKDHIQGSNGNISAYALSVRKRR